MILNTMVYDPDSIDMEDICDDLKSNDSLACLLALRYCVINQLCNEEIISIIRKLKSSELVEWGSCRVSDCAVAALHLLNVEEYSGNYSQINDLIETHLFSD